MGPLAERLGINFGMGKEEIDMNLKKTARFIRTGHQIYPNMASWTKTTINDCFNFNAYPLVNHYLSPILRVDLLGALLSISYSLDST